MVLDELENCLAASITVENDLSARELTLQIDRFLDTIDKESRVMFVRRYWYSDSISEIAALFRLSNHNVVVRLSRIREKLKAYLEKEGYKL